jgi:cyclin-dependent kinase 7
MAVSPVVTLTHEQVRSLASPLKSLASGQTSSNGTPKPAVVAPASGATLPPTLDLSEQMNEEEKRKYAKGTPWNTPPPPVEPREPV